MIRTRALTTPPHPDYPAAPAAPTLPQEADLVKWSAYYSAEDGRRPPWESGKPASYVLALLEEGASHAVERGRGSAGAVKCSMVLHS
jgi:hypothetical protein